MRLLIDVVVGLLWLLIKIGDSVLFAGDFIAKKFRKTIKRIKKYKLPTPNLNFSFPEIEFPRLRLNYSLPKRKKRIKVVKSKQINIFPGSIPQLLKFKYFIFGSIFSLIFIYLPLLVLIFLQNLPNPKLLELRDVSQTTKIYDRNNTLLYQIYANQNRTLVTLNSIPENLRNATIAIEDKEFYKNPGFDVGAIARAAIGNIQGKPLQGGSTITQQLIKSTLLTPEQSFNRKIKEAILAFWAEKIYTKDQILTMYFNQVSYGGTSWGVEAASKTYFGQDVKDLDLAQSAFLAGLTKAPTTYYPYGENPDLWRERQKEVLQRMVNLGYIKAEDKAQAEQENLTFLPPQSPIYAPHFVFYLKDLLVKKYGLEMVEKGGLSIVTSLDLPLQKKVENIVRTEVDKDINYNLTNGAALVTNPKNGDILAMVGSRDYENEDFGKVNITTSLRQPGSSVKVITYSAALAKGYTAATMINDSATVFGLPGQSYAPVNYDGVFHGNVSLRIALANSINVPAVKTLQVVGIETMVNLAKNMGITTWNDPQKYGLS
ncbi:MAG TPA: transglycosylase domain-containing protein, partial [Patescibacteria group bacterium]|nr:transglycosylase domain-containing protein [Patescibacteria group bacterium]